ncbi:aldo/keto reductase [Actinacidiphila glaucinigra]|uniref:aldo/keto reductase n=1 Tax=Actinacidiphila glaucinigra TaxID=235986 RepID=UPI00339EC0AB
MSDEKPAVASGTFLLGGDLPVHRLGYGAMRLTGPGTWGEPADRPGAVRVLRRAVELGVNFIDTADSYGPFVSEQIIRESLHPYDAGVVIATKGGISRQGPDRRVPLGRPEYLRQQTELSLRHLGVERIDLYQLHRVDPKLPLTEQVGTLAELQREGKIRHIGLSEVGVEQLKEARTIAEIVSVQNQYSLVERAHDDVLEYAERHGIAFIPWNPIAVGRLARTGGRLASAAAAHGATPGQLALAWLLHRSPVMLPIPGTSSVAHLEENIAAAGIQLSDAEIADLDNSHSVRG